MKRVEEKVESVVRKLELKSIKIIVLRTERVKISEAESKIFVAKDFLILFLLLNRLPSKEKYQLH